MKCFKDKSVALDSGTAGRVFTRVCFHFGAKSRSVTFCVGQTFGEGKHKQFV